MFNFFKKKYIYSPCDGKIKDIEEVDDPVFSNKTMGPGFAFEPSGNEIVSPISGVVSMVFPTKHAIGITDDDGVEWLIHIGIDTVNLKGEGFELFVETKQRIKAQETLMKIDIDFIKTKGFKTDIIVIATAKEKLKIEINKDHYKLGERIGKYDLS